MKSLTNSISRFAAVTALVGGLALSANAQQQPTPAQIRTSVMAQIEARDLAPAELTAEQAEAVFAGLVAEFGEENAVAITGVLVQISPTPEVAALFVSAAIQLVPNQALQIMASVPTATAAATVAALVADGVDASEMAEMGITAASLAVLGVNSDALAAAGVNVDLATSASSAAAVPNVTAALPFASTDLIQDSGNVVSPADAN